MEVKSDRKRKSLDALPASDDKYWEGAKKEQIEIKEGLPCKHCFVRVSAREVECINCHVGFVLDSNFTLKKDHIYYKNRRVV